MTARLVLLVVLAVTATVFAGGIELRPCVAADGGQGLKTEDGGCTTARFAGKPGGLGSQCPLADGGLGAMLPTPVDGGMTLRCTPLMVR